MSAVRCWRLVSCARVELPLSVTVLEISLHLYYAFDAMRWFLLSLSVAGASIAAHTAAALPAEPERVLRFPIVEGLFPTLVYVPGGCQQRSGSGSGSSSSSSSFSRAGNRILIHICLMVCRPLSTRATTGYCMHLGVMFE
jgi:hypothetical protein